MHTPTLGIIGIGHVGSAVLQEAVVTGNFGRIITIDIDRKIAHGEALDQHHSTALSYLTHSDVFEGTYEDLKDADVIIVAAGPSIIPNDHPDGKPDRTLLAEVNAKVIHEVVGKIADVTTDPVVILITNPLDSMVFVGENVSGYPADRIFGTGTMLDSARLRRILADDCRIDPKSVDGYMMGEHGMSAVPVLSRARIGGMSILEAEKAFGVEFDPAAIQKRVVDSAYEVLVNKGSTNAGVARSAILLARAVLFDERSIFPVCTTLRGEYGYNGDVVTSMPTLIGATGVQRRFEVSLDQWESEAFERSIASIKETIERAKSALGM